MGRKYASAKHTIAECDRCGFQYKLKELKNLYIKAKDTNIKVCKECWEPDHPQNMQGMYPVDDPQAILLLLLVQYKSLFIPTILPSWVSYCNNNLGV